MSEWQPIETAPKDGTPVLVWMRKKALRAHYDRNEFAKNPRPLWRTWEWDVTWCRANQPTHWMPLPDPPGSVGAAVGAGETENANQ